MKQAMFFLLVFAVLTVRAQSTAFTYQGRLTDGGAAANGTYDMRFTLYDTAAGDEMAGEPITNSAVAVSNGLFRVELAFGDHFFSTSQGLWLEIAVRTNGGAGDYVALAPLQSLTATPFAITAGDLRGPLQPYKLQGLYPASVQFTANNNQFNGNFSGWGSDLDGVNAVSLEGLSAGRFWKLGGNAVNSPETDYLGTTNNQPLDFYAGGVRVLRLERGRFGGGNFIAGRTNNRVSFIAGSSSIGGGDENVIHAFSSVIGGGLGNVIGTNALRSVIDGGIFNQIDQNASHSVIGGGSENRVSNNVEHGVISGGRENVIEPDAQYVTIGGGHGNRVHASNSAIAGGAGNSIQPGAGDSSIGGGAGNSVGTNATGAVIAGGVNNRVDASAVNSTVAGGTLNFILENAQYATIPGGYLNRATNFAFAAGNRAKADHTGAFVWADSQEADFRSTSNNQFAVRAAGGARFETAGAGLTVDGQTVLAGTVPASALSGTYSQTVTLNNPANSFAGTGAGLTALNASQLASGTVEDARLSANVSLLGPSIESAEVNAASFDTTFWRVGGNTGTMPGAHFLGTTDNQALELRVNNQRALRVEPNSASPNLIGGFSGNFIAAGYVGSTIGGGGSLNQSNTIYASYATIAGGRNNDIGTNSLNSVIGGGVNNNIAAYSFNATIAGGFGNYIGTNADYSAIGGGSDNNIAANSSGATIAGGDRNNIGINSDYSAIGGGSDNNIAANALYATIPGGDRNFATNRAFAAGTRAKASHTGSFVWADSANADFASTADDQFQVRAGGGVNIVSPTEMATLRLTSIGGSPVSWGLSINQSILSVMTISNGGQPRVTMPANGNFGIGNTNPTARLHVVNATCDGTSWINASDRNIKTNFRSVDTQAILQKVSALPITRWSYRTSAAEDHIGPVAQDFRAAFGLGGSDTSIATVDTDGVALAAIQGLNAKLEEQKRELHQLASENATLKKRLDALEKLIRNQD